MLIIDCSWRLKIRCSVSDVVDIFKMCLLCFAFDNIDSNESYRPLSQTDLHKVNYFEAYYSSKGSPNSYLQAVVHNENLLIVMLLPGADKTKLSQTQAKTIKVIHYTL